MRAYSTAELSGEGLEELGSLVDLVLDPWVAYVPPRFLSPEELVAKLSEVGAEIFIVEADYVPAKVFHEVSLRAVVVCRGDPWNVDVAAATAAGVPVVRTPARNAQAVAELALAMALALMRGLIRADSDVRAGRWVVEGRIAYQRLRGVELAGKTVGVVGLGAVGRAFARICSALGCRVLAHDPYAPAEAFTASGAVPAGLDELLASSDLVSLHAALTPETTRMIGARELELMREGAYLVNTARAQLVDGEALLQALTSGRLGGAGLDHFEGEFLPQDHPLTRLENVLLTPHIGGATRETVERQTRMVAEAVRDLLAGRRPANLVNPEVWKGTG